MAFLNHWELLRETTDLALRRHGRFLVAELRGPHRVLSTSVRNGGQHDGLRHLVNHQSCEGAGHLNRHRVIHEQAAYHDTVCAELDLDSEATALMGTAANMSYAAVVVETDGALEVMAAVTAGVQTNAVCAGDRAQWRESENGFEKVAADEVQGTINVLLHVNRPLAPAALARAVVTLTEGKTAALQRLAVPSCYSSDLATGTGTDQYCLAAPLSGSVTLSSTSPHVKVGELIGVAVRRATAEALRWQNGLEPSYTRGLFHALGRHGISEAALFEEIASRLSSADLDLLRKNAKAAFYEPLVGAAAHALATVLDRVRHGTLPASVAREAIVQQAASIAVSLAAHPARWAEFRDRLHAGADKEPKELVLSAIALGWREKWGSN